MPITLFDTHCHLTTKDLLPRADQVIADAVQAGVTRLITVACGITDAELAMELRSRHPSLRIAAGIHPHDAAKAGEADLERLSAIWREPGVVAAGEMGLDYHYDFSPRPVQQKVFRDQLERATIANLPIIVHCRNAQQDAIEILLGAGFARRSVVFHCFSGTAQEAEELRSHGWWTSFTGLITFRNADEQRKACAAAPLDQLMFETDSPYLAPEPVRHMRPNQPQNLRHTVAFAAKLLGLSFEELAGITTANALRFFRLQTEHLTGADRPA